MAEGVESKKVLKGDETNEEAESSARNEQVFSVSSAWEMDDLLIWLFCYRRSFTFVHEKFEKCRY